MNYVNIRSMNSRMNLLFSSNEAVRCPNCADWNRSGGFFVLLERRTSWSVSVRWSSESVVTSLSGCSSDSDSDSGKGGALDGGPGRLSVETGSDSGGGGGARLGGLLGEESVGGGG